MSNMFKKAVLVVGGQGKRIPELTGGIIPKSLCFIKGKPLLTYQIQILVLFGVKDFLLVFEKDWQVALFQNFVQNNFFPKARYRTCVLDWQKSKNPFAYKEIQSFITNSAFIFSHGDIFYNSEILEKYKAFGSKKVYACMMLTKTCTLYLFYFKKQKQIC